MQLSTHFKAAEFACHCGCGFGTRAGDVSLALLFRLEELREHFGQPITITSGCRCEKHNASVGGAVHSQHKLGNAADIVVKSVQPHDVYKYVNAYYSTGGAGKYSSFTHVDVRSQKRYWHGSA